MSAGEGETRIVVRDPDRVATDEVLETFKALKTRKRFERREELKESRQQEEYVEDGYIALEETAEKHQFMQPMRPFLGFDDFKSVNATDMWQCIPCHKDEREVAWKYNTKGDFQMILDTMPDLENEWRKRHALITADSVPDVGEAPPVKRPCWEADMCIHKGKGLLLAAFKAKIDTVFRVTFPMKGPEYKQIRDELLNGYIVLSIHTEEQKQPPRHFHVSLQYRKVIVFQKELKPVGVLVPKENRIT